MENLLSLIPFGWVTLSVVGLILIILMVAVIYQIGIEGLKVLLNSNHENAPEFNWENRVWSLSLKCLPTKARVEKVADYWRVHMYSNRFKDLVNNSHAWTESDEFYRDCLTSNYESIKKHEGRVVDINKLGEYSLSLVAVETILLLASHYFFPTIILLGIATIVYGIRMLAGKVYSNTSKLSSHGERIITLEESSKGKGE